MAVEQTAQERAAARRPRREREEELLVWPDLVFVEFIAAVLFTVTLFILSWAINAPLLDKANPDVTPNPSKAPWYFLNLQELLLHMHPALAGVIVPTVFLILLAAIPYYDRSNDGQGVWFGTPNAGRITVFSMIYGGVLTLLLILYDAGMHVRLYEDIFNTTWPSSLNFLRNLRALQTDVAWPEWTRSIPYLPFEVTIRGQSFQNLDFPAWLVEQFIPVATMVGLSLLLLLILWRMRWVTNRHDAMIALFSGFIGTFLVLTIVGTAFRGAGMELMWPWDVHIEE